MISLYKSLKSRLFRVKVGYFFLNPTILVLKAQGFLNQVPRLAEILRFLPLLESSYTSRGLSFVLTALIFQGVRTL